MGDIGFSGSGWPFFASRCSLVVQDDLWRLRLFMLIFKESDCSLVVQFDLYLVRMFLVVQFDLH